MATSGWQEEFHRTFEQLKGATEAEMSRVESLARADGMRCAAEGLNQTLRRLRQSSQASEALSILVEDSSPFCARAAALVFRDQTAHVTSVRGFTADAREFEVARAAAVLAAIDTQDPVVAAASEAELSAELWRAAAKDVDKAYLFPLVAGGSVRAMLVVMGQVQAAPLEVLSEAAAMRLETLAARNSDLVRVAQPESPQRTSGWKDLPAGEQAAHLRAQRFARVKVAEMRLARPDALREGQERSDIYAVLKPEIDAAREEYKKQFGGVPTMVDYLSLELVRSLANEDDRLLGPDIPSRLF